MMLFEENLSLDCGDYNSCSFQGKPNFYGDLFVEIPEGLYLQWQFLEHGFAIQLTQCV